MFMTPVNLPMTEGEERRKGNVDEDAYAFLLELVRECMRAGLFRAEIADAELVAQTLWAGVHGVAALEITACQNGWIDWRSVRERCDFMLESIMRGMARTPDAYDGTET
jgi:hypothetical protein